jgi:hypothetical protein
MIFLFPVPLWFVLLGLAGSLVFLIYDMMEDAAIRAEQHDRIFNQRTPEEVYPEAYAHFKDLLEPGSADLNALLKRLAASRK